MNRLLANVLSQEAVMGDTVTGEEILDKPKDIEETIGRVSSDVSMVEIKHEVEKAIIEKEELEKASSSLESIVLSLESFDSVDSQTYGVHQYATSLVTGDVFSTPGVSPFNYDKNPETSLEGLGSDIKNIISKIWQAIKSYFNKIWNFIKSFFEDYFSNLSELEKSLSKVKSRFDKIKKDGGVPRADVVRLTYPHRLHVDGQLDHKVIFDGTNEIRVNILDSIYENNLDRIKVSYDGIYEWFKDRDNDKLSQLYDIVKRFNSDMLDLHQNRSNSKPLPGCKNTTLVKDATNSKLAMPTYLTITSTEKCKEYRGKGTIEIPSVDMLELLIEVVDVTLGVVSKHKDDVKSIQEVRNETKDKADDWVKSVERGSIQSNIDKVEVRQALRIATNNSIKGIVDINKYLYDYSAACLDLLDKSLTGYE